MGFIRTHHFRRAADVNPKSDVEHIESVDVKSLQAEHVETAEILDETVEDTTEGAAAIEERENAYQILSKRTPEHDLPLIPPSVVQKRDGKEGRRLCTYTPTCLPSLPYVH